MRTLKQFYYFTVLLLLLAVGIVLRLFGWRPEGDTGIQTLFNRAPQGFAVVNESVCEGEPYPYVYVNADGSARELHRSERDYLETIFHGADGGRPYVKWRYGQKDGWGEIKGFLKRSRVPKRIRIDSVPVEDPMNNRGRAAHIEFLREKGFEVTENSDGSFTAAKPKVFRTDLLICINTHP
jgi:hypothetical protein